MMKRTLVHFLLLGLIGGCGGEPVKGDPGERGDKGEPGQAQPPSLELVTPLGLFAGRAAVLQIGGVGTRFSAVSTVNFGDPAIKVQKVELGSATSLRVTVDVGLGARIGAHDVTVSSPSSPADGQGPVTVTLTGGFTVMASLLNVAPLGMTMGPTVAQGGFTDLAARNLDYRENPLYAGARVSGPFLPIGATTVSGVTVATGALVDALAPTGPLQTTVATVNPLGQTVSYVADAADSAAVKIKARAATALATGITKAGEVLADKRATNLYKVTTTADNQALLLAFSSLGSALSGAIMGPSLSGLMAPASGRFSEGASLGTSATVNMMGALTARNGVLMLPKAGDYYFSIYASDQSGSANHSYAVTAKTAAAGALPSLKEPTTMPPEGPTMPLVNLAALDKPYFGTDGALDTGFESDYIRFQTTRAGRVYVAATGTAGVSMGLVIRGADCTTFYVATSYSSSGSVANEAEVADATTYCVRILADGAPTPYQILIVPSP